MKPYIHTVHYYETDKMGITHHSNYIRWMEEARVDFLEQLGYGFDRMEKDGIASPVLEVECRYRHSTTFSDKVSIVITPEKIKGLKFFLNYEMKNVATGEIVATGTTCHCFFDKNNVPMRIETDYPGFCEKLMSEVKE